jgi:hypothetical protein
MIEAMIAGESNPRALAMLADRRLKARPDELRAALHGRLNETHRCLLRAHSKQWDERDAASRATRRIRTWRGLLRPPAEGDEGTASRRAVGQARIPGRYRARHRGSLRGWFFVRHGGTQQARSERAGAPRATDRDRCVAARLAMTWGGRQPVG